jgi:hypothetical protein
VFDDNTESVPEAFQRSILKSVARASRQLGMTKMTLWKVLVKLLCFKPYNVRLVQSLTAADKVKLREFLERTPLKT